MRRRTRITNILIAGTLTAILLTLFLAFRGQNAVAVEAVTVSTNEAALVEMVGDYETDIATLQAQIESLQAQNSAYATQNEELRTAVTTLQARESEYQSQIETANATINELSAQTSGLAQSGEGLVEPRRPHNH